ncbi:hypothetical protein [Novosphingobium sp. Chol11]|uniref:hypothetical protein n=1 Tax=Novosphingobium sp. Chol11 TaxID=1385763 RepID=UPI0025ECF9FB|nr:hypothetical protein [Novosphingobium sp. Chol11]
MAKTHRDYAASPQQQIDWRKSMSDTVAYALLVYTALQIFVTMRAMEGDRSSMLPMLALVVLVAAIIPMFRHIERRWDGLSPAAAADPAMRAACRRDQLAVWALAIGLPFLLTALFKGVTALF